MLISVNSDETYITLLYIWNSEQMKQLQGDVLFITRILMHDKAW